MNRIVLLLSVFFVSFMTIYAQQPMASIKVKLFRSDDKPLSNESVTFKSMDNKSIITTVTDERGNVDERLVIGLKYNLYFQDYVFTKIPKVGPFGLIYQGNGGFIIDEFIYANLKVTLFSSYDGNPLANEELLCRNTKTGIVYSRTTDDNGYCEFYIPRDEEYEFFSNHNKNILRTYFVKKAKEYAIYSVSLELSTYSIEDDAQLEKDAIIYEKERIKRDSIIKNTPHDVLIYMGALSVKTVPANFINHSSREKYAVYLNENKENLLGEIDYIWDSDHLRKGENHHLCNASIANDDTWKMSFNTKLKPGKYEVYIESDSGEFQEKTELIVEPSNWFSTKSKIMLEFKDE